MSTEGNKVTSAVEWEDIPADMFIFARPCTASVAASEKFQMRAVSLIYDQDFSAPVNYIGYCRYIAAYPVIVGAWQYDSLPLRFPVHSFGHSLCGDPALYAISTYHLRIHIYRSGPCQPQSVIHRFMAVPGQYEAALPSMSQGSHDGGYDAGRTAVYEQI